MDAPDTREGVAPLTMPVFPLTKSICLAPVHAPATLIKHPTGKSTIELNVTAFVLPSVLAVGAVGGLPFKAGVPKVPEVWQIYSIGPLVAN